MAAIAMTATAPLFFDDIAADHVISNAAPRNTRRCVCTPTLERCDGRTVDVTLA